MAIERQPNDDRAEKRYAPRKPVALTLRAWIAGAEREITVRDLSHTGFLVETTPPLTLNQTIALELPHEGRKDAKVVWAGDSLAGCTFEGTISKASVSAALLKSEVRHPTATIPSQVFESLAYAGDDDPEIEKLPVPVRLAVIGAGSVLAWVPLVLLGSALLG